MRQAIPALKGRIQLITKSGVRWKASVVVLLSGSTHICGHTYILAFSRRLLQGFSLNTGCKIVLNMSHFKL